MIEDDFYSTIKFKSGEEIFCKVAASDDRDWETYIFTLSIK